AGLARLDCVLVFTFFFSSRRRHTRFSRDWSSDVCSSDLDDYGEHGVPHQCLWGLRRRECAGYDLTSHDQSCRLGLSPPDHEGAPLMSNTFDWRWIPRGILLGLLAFAIFGPLANLLLWAVAERWYFPHTLPLQ